jgi:RimJ/RimL family protein N-acetyltransferase
MLYDTAVTIEPREVLFSDQVTTALMIPGAIVRQSQAADVDHLKRLDLDAEAGWVMEVGGLIVAAGGVLFHYNPPFGDIYMKVTEGTWRRGYGSYFVQELKRASYEMGKVPAARCNAENTASRATLQRAGMLPCGRMLVGKILET